jgi:methyl-accepting chemotaxis protein
MMWMVFCEYKLKLIALDQQKPFTNIIQSRRAKISSLCKISQSWTGGQPMSEDLVIAQRMNFMKLDEEGRAAIRSLKPLIDKALPAILDAFYVRIRNVPEVGHFFTDSARAVAAKDAQLRHWARISSGDFNSEYLRSVQTIGQTHARIGLEPKWYIGGYALITEGLVAAALAEVWPKQQRAGLLRAAPSTVKSEDVATALGALIKAVLLDMDIAISTYIEAAEEGRRRAEEASAAAAKEQAVVVEAITKGLAHLAKGDLTYKSTEPFASEYQKVQDDFNSAMDQLRQTVHAIAAATGEVASASAEISSGTTDLSERTERQAASLEQTSASMEQISSTVKKNAGNAEQASQFTEEMREVANRGGAVVDEAVGAMGRIKQSSGKISDIIGVIDEIARQTNLLALNAAVEAARAGEAGRGFAVVASEVRSLAQRSSQAAKDIKDLITTSTRQVEDGVDLVNKTGVSFKEIADSIKKVAEIVADIATASSEQSSGIEQVNIAITQMDEVTQQNSALVEQNAAAAKALEQQSAAMERQVGFFQLDQDAVAAKHAANGSGRPVVQSPPPPPLPPRPAAEAKRTITVASSAGPAAAPAASRAPMRKSRTALTAAVNERQNWKEF